MFVSPLALGIVAPGLSEWSSACAVLRGEQPYVASPLSARPPASLTPNERRRATLATRLALDAAQQATAGANLDTSALSSIFASADGDMSLIDSMCREIYQQHLLPSPTVFQNSVHNAVAGYWSIAEGCQRPSNSVAAGDGSFAAGLLEAATQLAMCREPVLLVAFDLPAPELLHPQRPFTCAFACAMVLTPERLSTKQLMLELSLCDDPDPKAPTQMQDAELEAMRTGNPAARALPLLAAIAAQQPTVVRLPYWPDLQLEARLNPRSELGPDQGSEQVRAA